MKKIIIILLFALIASSGISQQKKVLFLGNSYTGANNLPLLFKELAISGDQNVLIDNNAPGGYTLAYPDYGHLYNQTSLDKIVAEDWDYVVLQEQSQYPVIDYYFGNYTFPGSAELDSIIEQNYNCSQTLFFMTWGRKYGGQQCIGSHCSVNFVDYAHMQDSLASRYLQLSENLDTPVSPVGMAWKKSIVENGDPVDLFGSDGAHPSMAGSYLAACTFYAAIFHESPEGLSYTAGLDNEIAFYLQTVASETVFSYLNTWNIDTTTVSAAFDHSIVGGTVTFQNLSLNADHYLWDFGNGDSDTTANPVYTYSESGTYEVSLIAEASECKIDTAYSMIQVIISQDNEITEDINTINFYPNPGKGIFYFKNSALSGVAQIQVLDINGKLVYQEERELTSGNVETLNLGKLPAGTYFCNIQLDENLYTSRIVVDE